MARILVIEDQEDIRTLLGVLLAEAGMEAAFADSGEAGMALVPTFRPDVVVLDLVLPGMMGFEVIRLLRAELATARVPIVVVSAKTYPADQRKALDMGATQFIAKPFDPRSLIDHLRRIVTQTTLTFWGVRGSIAAPGPETIRYGGNTPCVSVAHRGHTLILDAGTGIRKLGLALQTAARGQPLSVDLLVSHTHWDHIQGFPFFLPAFVPGNHVRVYGPRSPDKPLERVLRGQMDPEYFPVALGDLAAEITVHEFAGQPWQIGPYRVRAGYLHHPGVTLGFRLEADDLTIVYATDTEPYRSHLSAGRSEDRAVVEFGRRCDQELLDLIADADVYIGDAQYFPDEYARKTGWGHTSYVDTVALALEAGVKHLVLFSHDPMHDDAKIDAKLAHCRQLVQDRGSNMRVTAAAEGVPLDLHVLQPA